MSARFVIPCTPGGFAFWKQRTQLDGVDYVIVFRWLQRDGHWWIDLLDQDESPIRSGIKLVTTWPLLRGVTDARRPAGEIIVDDSLGIGDDPGFDDLGTRFILSYMSPT